MNSDLRKKVPVVFFVEHVDRELDLVCLLKNILEKRYGLQSEVVSIEFGRDAAIRSLDPSVVVLPYSFTGLTSHSLPPIITGFAGARYVDMSYEQIYHGLNQEWRGPKDAFSRNHVVHLAWGRSHIRFLMSHGVPRQNIIQTGNPIYDLYREEYRNYFGSRHQLAVKHGLDPSKVWVFVPENYKAAFLPDAYLQLFVNRGADANEVVDYREHDRVCFAAAVEWWVAAARSGKCEVIVRPRPATVSEHLTAAMRMVCPELPAALHVTKAHTVREWLLASDIATSSISTTLIEAAVARKTVYTLEPSPTPRFLKMDWLSKVESIKSRGEFVRVATTPEVDANWRRLRTWVSRRMPFDGSIDRVVETLVRIALRQVQTPEAPTIEGIERQPQVPPNIQKRLAIRMKVRRFADRIRKVVLHEGQTTEATGRRVLDASMYKTHFGEVNLFEKDHFASVEVTDRCRKWSEVCHI